MHQKDINRTMGGLSAQERDLIRGFVAAERPVVTVNDVLAVRPGSKAGAGQMLLRLHQKGWLRRIKRGHYTVVPLAAATPEPPIEDAWPFAMSLFAPCFISGWSAAEHWDLTEQIFNAIAIVTLRGQRKIEQSLGNVTFRTRILSKARFFGATDVWMGSQRIAIADPHRLLIDVLDDPSFGGGGRQTVDIVRAYWRSPHAKPELLLEYARRYKGGTVFKRLGFTAELAGAVGEPFLSACRKGMSEGVSNLDPAGPQKGHIVSRWRLRINMPIDEHR